LKGREDMRYIEYLRPERAIVGLLLRRAFVLTAMVVVGAVLVLLSFSAFSGRPETAFWQKQTSQAASQDYLAPAGPVAPQDESPSETYSGALPSQGPVVSFECIGYWCYIVQGFSASPG